jgi:hypothetical protein
MMHSSIEPRRDDHDSAVIPVGIPGDRRSCGGRWLRARIISLNSAAVNIPGHAIGSVTGNVWGDTSWMTSGSRKDGNTTKCRAVHLTIDAALPMVRRARDHRCRRVEDRAMDRRRFLLATLVVAVTPTVAGAKKKDKNNSSSDTSSKKDENGSSSDTSKKDKSTSSTDTSTTDTSSTDTTSTDTSLLDTATPATSTPVTTPAPVATGLTGEGCSVGFVNGLLQFSADCSGLTIPGLAMTVMPPSQLMQVATSGTTNTLQAEHIALLQRRRDHKRNRQDRQAKKHDQRHSSRARKRDHLHNRRVRNG